MFYVTLLFLLRSVPSDRSRLISSKVVIWITEVEKWQTRLQTRYHAAIRLYGCRSKSVTVDLNRSIWLCL